MDEEAAQLEQAKRGDAEVFATLVDPYLPMLLAYSRAICGDYHAAQDVVQETVLIAFRNLTHLFPEADFGVWLRAIARRQALAARRKLARLPAMTEVILESVYDDPRPVSAGPYQDALGQCLEVLGGRMRQVVNAHYFDGSQLAHIAARLAMTTAAAKQLLYRARLWLRECVEKRLAGGET